MIKPQIDANNRKYQNGKLGGRPKNNQNETKIKPKINQTITKTKPNVNDNDNVNENNNINNNTSSCCIKEKKEEEKKETQFDIVDYCEQKSGVVENIQKKDLLNPDRTKITTSDDNSIILKDIKDWWNNSAKLLQGLIRLFI